MKKNRTGTIPVHDKLNTSSPSPREHNAVEGNSSRRQDTPLLPDACRPSTAPLHNASTSLLIFFSYEFFLHHSLPLFRRSLPLRHVPTHTITKPTEATHRRTFSCITTNLPLLGVTHTCMSGSHHRTVCHMCAVLPLFIKHMRTQAGPLHHPSLALSHSHTSAKTRARRKDLGAEEGEIRLVFTCV